MLPYAEQYLEQHANNQWFVRFFAAENDLAGQKVKQDQLNWFVSQGLTCTEVRTLEYDLPHTELYHVNFTGAHDVRLKAYTSLWEDQQGVSLQPDLYQAYEWSYSAWCEQGLQQAWHAHIEKQLTA